MPTTVLLEVRSQKRKFSTNNDNDGISGNESAKKDSGITFTDVDIEIIKRHTNACKVRRQCTVICTRVVGPTSPAQPMTALSV